MPGLSFESPFLPEKNKEPQRPPVEWEMVNDAEHDRSTHHEKGLEWETETVEKHDLHAAEKIEQLKKEGWVLDERPYLKNDPYWVFIRERNDDELEHAA